MAKSISGRTRSTTDAAFIGLEGSIPNLLRQTYRSFSKQLETAITPYGVTMGMWFFLRALWEEDGLTQSELSERIGIRGPTTVSAMSKMEALRLIRREKDPDDKRTVRVFLSDRGRQLQGQLIPKMVELIDYGTQDLSVAEYELMISMLQRMRGRLSVDIARDRL